MGIKQFISFVLIFLAVQVNGQGIEMQRKYGLSEPKKFTKHVLSSGELAGFKSEHHSDLVYYDLYLDTPDYWLSENGFSLRLRKKQEDKNQYAYVFQLKSEMESANGIRMEVEETELDFYALFHENAKIYLSQLLDSIFDQLQMADFKQQPKNYEPYFKELQEWINFKAGAPITPFQKLRFLFPETFTIAKLQSLQPILIGRSKRSRSHIYITADTKNNQLGEFAQNQVIGRENPPFFNDHADFYWLFESSLDSSIFYPLFPSNQTSLTIMEYELENKFPVDSISIRLMNTYESALKSEFGLYNTLNSKYLQSILAFKLTEK